MSNPEVAPAVLIIEDEPVLRSSMVRGLLRDSAAQVVGAATVAEARALIEQLRPAFIISDLDLPDGTGLEVIDILDRLGMRVPILFASAYVPKYRPQIPSRSEIEVREKPIPLRELRAAVEQRVGVHSLGNSGEVGPFSAPDYIQLACMCHRSAEIRLEREGAVVGRVYIQGGELFDAEYGALRGEQAVLRLVYDQDLLARCLPLRAPVARVITSGWQNVLLEAARRHDEANRDAKRPSGDWSGTFIEDGSGPDDPPFADAEVVVVVEPPVKKPGPSQAPRRPMPPLPPIPAPRAITQPAQPAARRPPPEPKPGELEYERAERRLREFEAKSSAPVRSTSPRVADPKAEFERLFDAAVQALLSKDYPSAYRYFEEAQIYDPSEPRVRTNLERLKVLGVRGPNP